MHTSTTAACSRSSCAKASAEGSWPRAARSTCAPICCPMQEAFRNWRYPRSIGAIRRAADPRSTRSTPKPMLSRHSMLSGRIDYEAWSEVMPGVRARYWNAGHLLGSASIELEFASEGSSGQPLRVLASGDIGPDAKLLQPDPEAPTGFDYVISELTYGHATARRRPPWRAASI